MGPESGLGTPTINKLYDAATGEYILSLTNATDGGTITIGPNGELLIYFLDGTNNWLAMWNSTQAIWNWPNPVPNPWDWRLPVGATLDWQAGVQWNVTTPQVDGQAIYEIDSGIILATTGNILVPQNWQMEAAYDAQTGANLWIENRTTPAGATTFGLMGPLKNGIYAEYDKGVMQWTGYNASTGKQIWGPSKPYSNAWDSIPQDPVGAYGNIYQPTLSGIHALNLATGERLWDFTADSSGTEFPGFSTLPFLAASLSARAPRSAAPTPTSHHRQKLA